MKWIDDAVDCHHCTPEFAEEVRGLLEECGRALEFIQQDDCGCDECNKARDVLDKLRGQG